MSKTVSIIIVNYNGLFYLKKCLRAIKKQNFKHIEIVVVDNNSSDNTIAYLEKDHPEIKIIKNKINFGFAKANNEGAKIAKGYFLFFLNNDTELFPNTVEQLLAVYRPNSILTGFQISTRDKKSPGHSGAGMDIFGYSYSNQKDYSKTKVFYADGAALFLKKKDFMQLGMFDEKLFMFQEDVDLSWRAQILGYTIIPCLNAKLYHYYGGTASVATDKSNKYVSSFFRRYLNERNVMRNIIKNYSFPLVLLVLVFLLFFHIGEIFFLLITGNVSVVKCYFAAYWWNIKNLGSSLKIRKRIQKKRIVSDWELLKRMYFKYSKLYMYLKVGMPKFH